MNRSEMEARWADEAFARLNTPANNATPGGDGATSAV